MPIWQNVDPGLVTDGVSADTSFGVSRGDFHAGQNGAALICNGAADLSSGTLPSGKRTADHKYEPCTRKRIRYAFHFSSTRSTREVFGFYQGAKCCQSFAEGNGNRTQRAQDRTQ